ncbi:MAG: S8 family serine peptidase, partial [Desulfuromonadales bacterium]|nr:S8 family serine peptidase [Desulfuromonadales bacterium]
MKKVFALALLLVVCSFATSLAAPAPPEMTLSTNTLEVTVSWSPVDDATGYHLYYAPYPFTGPETIGSLEMGNETSFSIELWEGAAYYIAVKAYNDDGESDYSNIDAFIINANGMFTYSALPTLNETATLTFDSEEDLGGIEWRVVSEPHGSELALQVAADNRSVAFTPQQVGGYEIVVRSTAVNFRQVTSFTIAQPFSYDEGQIDGNDGTVDLSEIIGAIKNQSWVYSDTLTESQIRAIVSLFSDLAIMGYDPIQGLLIEYDEEGVQLTGSLAALKNEAGITSVINRVYEGEDAFETNLIPDDGSSFFDGGNNWHLEFIDAPLAWDITTGNSEIVVGVVDAGFDITHSELSGRVSELLTDSKDLHGNGCAGAIGALTDNGQGISGVNWISQMSLSLWGYSNTASMVAKTNVPVSSHSWTNVAAPNDFDLTDTTAVEEQDALSLLRTRSYRKLALSYPEKMMVRSAGNGVGNGRGYAGVYGMDARHGMAAMHYDDNGALDKLNNVLFVAAMNNADHLVHYSNYGEAVDIAAPTHFTSIGVDQSLIGFSGTSASTPVVSGVASLIYSLNPDFTAQQVKDILINSATQYVSKRYVKPSSSDEETLAHPLPILNAANALDMAYEIINGNRLRLTDLVISGGALALEGEPLQLTATAYWSDGSSRDVSADAVWREDSPAIVSVNGGLVNAGQVSLDTPVLVSASFLFED